jgi:CRISPR-associated endonuclease/helicase Cas3
MSPYLPFWGKAQPVASPEAAFHPLAAHSLDVAATAIHLDAGRPIGVPASTLAFLAALHDIGKFSRSFQAKAPHVWPAAALGPFPGARHDPGHDTTGFALLIDDPAIAAALAPVFDGWLQGEIAPLFRAVAGHHGRPPHESARPPENAIGKPSRAAALAFVLDLIALFGPERIAPDLSRDAALPWRLAGLMTLADWIGSSQRHFPYARLADLTDLRRYWDDEARPRARRAIAVAGLAPAVPARFDGAARLLPDIKTLSPMQHLAGSAMLPPGPVLAILEDATGAGKTEAALILAHRLMADGRADGIFLGLPTMATANAMYRRMRTSYRRLFAEGVQPSLALAHGRAELDDGFTQSILTDAAEDAADVPTTAAADEPAGAQCAAWLAADRRQALLAQVGVGTIDQALLAVLPVRHAPLRQRALTGKVLMVDEAHAFDPYMREEVVRLLRFHAALGGSAIVLSATLPLRLRQMLADAWRAGLGEAARPVAAQGYPLATFVAGDGVQETEVAPHHATVRRVAVTRISATEDAVGRIRAAQQVGAAVAWVRNTVDDAIAACDELRAAGLEPMLFHARFAMADRLRIEEAVLARFGRDSTDRRGVLVATQVIEQSLDLDFDLMVTDLAPVDLLIQRAGRLHRHKRDDRPIERPELLLLSPDPVDEPGPDWLADHRGTEAVYRDPALLWRGARALLAAGGIEAPGGLRSLIEAAAEGEEPAGLRAAASRAEGKAFADAATARQNLLSVEGGYAEDAGLWASEERTPTRLEDRPQVTLRLARVRDGKVVPYAEDADERRAWALSEVAVAEHRIGTVTVPAEWVRAADEARSRWGRWERESLRVKLVVLEAEAVGRWRPQSGEAYRYSRESGLLFSDPPLRG